MRLTLKAGLGSGTLEGGRALWVSREREEVLSTREGRGLEEVGEARDGGQARPSLSLPAPNTPHISSLTVPMSSGPGLQVVFTPTTRWQEPGSNRRVRFRAGG